MRREWPFFFRRWARLRPRVSGLAPVFTSRPWDHARDGDPAYPRAIDGRVVVRVDRVRLRG